MQPPADRTSCAGHLNSILAGWAAGGRSGEHDLLLNGRAESRRNHANVPRGEKYGDVLKTHDLPERFAGESPVLKVEQAVELRASRRWLRGCYRQAEGSRLMQNSCDSSSVFSSYVIVLQSVQSSLEGNR